MYVGQGGFWSKDVQRSRHGCGFWDQGVIAVQGLPEVGTVRSEDRMDDGTRIALAVTINRRDGSAEFDFEGTGPEVFGNTNAPPAVTMSAVIYSLRCLVSRDIPLNGGCLAPVRIKVRLLCHTPPGSALLSAALHRPTARRVRRLHGLPLLQSGRVCVVSTARAYRFPKAAC